MPLRTAAAQVPGRDVPAVWTPAAYDEASEEVMSLLRDFGHPVEVWGWDEAYVGADVDDPIQLAGADPRGRLCRDRSVVFGRHQRQQAARQGRDRIRRSLAGIYQLTEDNWMAVMGDRDVDALWGVGPKTAKKACRHWALPLSRTSPPPTPHYSRRRSGRRPGLWILLLAKGGGDTNVSAEPWVPRSRSHVITFPRRPDRARRNRLGRSRSRSTDARRDRRTRAVWSPGSPSRCAPRRSSPGPRSASSPSASTDARCHHAHRAGASRSVRTRPPGIGCSACGSNCAVGGRLPATTRAGDRI